MVSVGQKGDFGGEWVNACDLSNHATRVNDGRAQCHVFEQASVDHNALVVGVWDIKQNFGRLRCNRHVGLKAHELAKILIFNLQLLNLLRAHRLLQHLEFCGLQIFLGLIQILKIRAHGRQSFTRLQNQPLNRQNEGRKPSTQRLGELQLFVTKHEQQRERAEKNELGQGRKAHPEKGRG